MEGLMSRVPSTEMIKRHQMKHKKILVRNPHKVKKKADHITISKPWALNVSKSFGKKRKQSPPLRKGSMDNREYSPNNL